MAFKKTASKKKAGGSEVKNTPPPARREPVADEGTQRVKFLEDCGVEGEEQFEAGKQYTLNVHSAYRWERRGKCEYV